MSNTYLTIGGESASSLAVKYYKDSSKSINIINANPDIYDQYRRTGIILETQILPANLNMIIPGITFPAKKQSAGTARKKKVSDDPRFPFENLSPDEIKAERDEVTMIIDGKSFRYFDDVNINLSLDTIADTFSLSCPFDSQNKVLRKLFQPRTYKECAIYIGGIKQITGHIVTIKTDTSPESAKITLDGYSRTGVLNDCIVAPDINLDIKNLDLLQIAQKICDPFGINVICETDQGAKFTGQEKIQLDKNRKCVEILNELAKLRNILISNTNQGELLLQKVIQTEKATLKIDASKMPCVKSNANFNGQSSFSHFVVTKSKIQKGQRGDRRIVTDPELVKNGIFRPCISDADSVETGALNKSATSMVGKSIAKSININADFFGWRKPDGNIWMPGEKILYKSENDMIYDFTELVVKNITFNKKSDSLTSSISFVFPDYSADIISGKYPWAQ